MNLQRYSKFITAALAFVGVILSSGLLDGATQAWVSTVVAGIGAALVYLLPNALPDSVTPATKVAVLRDAQGRFVAGPAHPALDGTVVDPPASPNAE